MNINHVESFDLNLFLVFAKIYNLKSITLASKELGLTQSAVSHSLKKLRDHFEDPLFIKTKNGMEPTSKSERIYPSVLDSLKNLNYSLQLEKKFDPKIAKKNFKVSMSDYVEIVMLTPLIKKLNYATSNIDLEVSNLPTNKTQEGLEKGDFELVIGNRDVQAGVKRQFLFEDIYITFVGKNNSYVKKELSLETFLNLQHILFSPKGRRKGSIDDYLEEKKLKRRISLRVPHLAVLPDILAHTDYVITLPKRMTEIICRSGQVKYYPTPVPLSPLKVYQYWHEKYDKDSANQWLRKKIKLLSEGFLD